MITVAKSLGLLRDDPLLKDSLPAGYSFLVDDDTSLPVEPVLLWLCSRFPPKPRRWKPNSVEPAAFDLCDWWRYLERLGMPWCDATTDQLDEYQDSLIGSVSPRTHRPYDDKTISRRIRNVDSFYLWAAKRGIFLGEALDPKIIKKMVRPIDSDSLAHTGGAKGSTEVSSVARNTNQSTDENVHPMESQVWLAVSKALGPLPSEWDAGGIGFCRDRLAAETSIWTGIRIDEVAGLTTYQILNLRVTEDPNASIPLKITRTKGLRPRTILIPSHLLAELQLYVDTERREAVELGKSFGTKLDSGALFVNGVNSRNHSGKPVQGYTLAAAFRSALLACGYVRSEQRVDPLTEQVYMQPRPLHTFHDLRHTFAVWLYQAEKACGNSEPWKVVQARLGHRYLKTTMDTYLRVVDIFRAKANDTVYRFMRATFGT